MKEQETAPDRIDSKRVGAIAIGSIVVFFLALGFAIVLMPRTKPTRDRASPAETGITAQTAERAAIDRDLDRAIDRLLDGGGVP